MLIRFRIHNAFCRPDKFSRTCCLRVSLLHPSGMYIEIYLEPFVTNYLLVDHINKVSLAYNFCS
jgi:hypothetical protein